MTRRRGFRPGDWESVAGRLDEILCAHGGDDPLGVALELVVAKLEHEAARPERVFVDPDADEAPRDQVRRLLESASRRWPGVLDAARTGIDERALERCAAVLREVELSADGLAGLDALFEVLVHSAHKGEKGQYFTPRHVARELAAMLAPKPGERIVDPACGSGNFLVIAYKEMRAIEAEINKRRDEADRRTDIPLTNFRGIELRDFLRD